MKWMIRTDYQNGLLFKEFGATMLLLLGDCEEVVEFPKVLVLVIFV